MIIIQKNNDGWSIIHCEGIEGSQIFGFQSVEEVKELEEAYFDSLARTIHWECQESDVPIRYKSSYELFCTIERRKKREKIDQRIAELRFQIRRDMTELSELLEAR